MARLDGYNVSSVPEKGLEREAAIAQAHGFYIRHPPRPHILFEQVTEERHLFQTIHMGAVDVDIEKWLLVVDGLVERPFALTFEQLLKLPSTSVHSVHECFGSPLAPATIALWRVGNVTWTGVSLCVLLAMARPLPSADYVWSEGLDSGTFANVEADCYQKDLPLYKARGEEVLIAYNMNGKPLGRERGGPVRLVVPGWFGTNSTKWLSKITLNKGRALGPYTTRFYNVEDQDDPRHRMKPVWEIDVNSMITHPSPDTVVRKSTVNVEGWAWSYDGVVKVEIKASNRDGWHEANLDPRIDFRWQRFTLRLALEPGEYVLTAKATSIDGKSQALSSRRNHVNEVRLKIEG
ncbi:electron carrier [Ascochyta rabiei]|uniref:Electron carrier n=1 Tax=Didymella rabiei TaxID=5454 RepID=A0A163IBP5_DIDRA|nr:electron carrier [Ascochyta rabiei]